MYKQTNKINVKKKFICTVVFILQLLFARDKNEQKYRKILFIYFINSFKNFQLHVRIYCKYDCM